MELNKQSLEKEYIRIKHIIEQNLTGIKYDKKVIEQFPDDINVSSICKESIDKYRTTINSLNKVLECEHSFVETNYSDHFKSEEVYMQTCEKCNITIQLKKDSSFTLGYWNEENSKKIDKEENK